MRKDQDRAPNLSSVAEPSRRLILGGLAAVTAIPGIPLLGAGSVNAQEQPKRGGRLRIGWYQHSANDTLDGVRISSTIDQLRVFQICNTLVRYGRDLAPEPELAVSWEASPDAKTWRFNLRKDVQFHNGKTLDADDVIYSIGRHIPESSRSAIRPLVKDIVGMRADGKNVVVFELSTPNADFPMNLGLPHAIIYPKDFAIFDRAVGTGAFKLSKFEPGIGMLAVRNDNYFYSGRPYVDEVETFGIGDTVARTNALLAGDVHFICRLDPKVVRVIERAPGVKMAPAKAPRYIVFAIMADRPPGNNADFRLALKYMADREGMLRDVQKGYGSVGNDVPLMSNERYYAPDLSQHSLDVEKARFHLRKAGMESASVELHTSEAVQGPVAVDLALHFRETAAKAGLNVQVVRQPTDGYWTATWAKKPFYMSSWAPRPTLDIRMTLGHTSGSSQNEGAYSTDKLDSLITEARGTLDEKKRTELYWQAERIVHDDAGSMIPLFVDWMDAISDKVKGYVPHPFNEAAGCRMADEVWLA